MANFDNLIIGQKVWGTVSEISRDGSLIANFNGSLVRIANNSTRKFRQGERVQLMVVTFKVQDIRANAVPHKRLRIDI